MHPVLLSLGPATIYSYGFMVALAFISGIYLSYLIAEKEGIPKDRILDMALYVLVFSIIGARLFYVIGFWPYYYHNPAEILLISKGGLVFYGGLFFTIVTLFVLAKINNIDFLKLLDVISPGAALGYAIGRIGCFLNGCCYGIETNFFCALKFPNVSGLRHPTQIYASISGLIIMGLLLFLFRRKRFDGQIIASGLIFYSLYRFSIEFIRVNERYIWGLSQAQLLSIIIFVMASIFYGWQLLQKRSWR